MVSARSSASIPSSVLPDATRAAPRSSSAEASASGRWPVVEELRCSCEQLGVAGQQAARMGRDGGDRAHVGIQLGAALGRRHGARRQLVVVRRDRDANQVRVVGDIRRKQRQDRFALFLAEGAQPRSRRECVARGHRLEREQPRGLPAKAGRALVYQPAGERRRHSLQARDRRSGARRVRAQRPLPHQGCSRGGPPAQG